MHSAKIQHIEKNINELTLSLTPNFSRNQIVSH